MNISVLTLARRLYLPASPYQTASWFRGKNGWFTEREEVSGAHSSQELLDVDEAIRSYWQTELSGMIRLKVICTTGKRCRMTEQRSHLSDNPFRQAVTPHLLWNALKDYDMWPIYLIGLSWTIPEQCATAYLTLILGSLDFNTFQVNLLTVPAYVLFTLQLLFWSWTSERINNRFLIILFCQVYMFPLVIALETLPAGHAYAWGRYALNALLVGFPYVHAILGKFPPISSFHSRHHSRS